MTDDGDERDGDENDPAPFSRGSSQTTPVQPHSESSRFELDYDEDPSPPRDGGLEAAVDEMEGIAERYRSDGWKTFNCHPGGVDVLTGDGEDERFGIEVVVPDNELDDATELLEEGSFDTYQVFRGTVVGVVLFVVAVEDATNETALLFAGYFHPQDAEPLFDRDGPADSFSAYLRAMSGEYVEFDSLDVEFFRPERDPREDGEPAND